MRKVFVAIAILAVVAGCVWWFYGREKSQEFSYQLVAVEKGDIVSLVSATGTINPVETVDVGTQVSGRIDKLYADYNDHVTKGQLVATLDRSLLENAVLDAESSLQKSRAQYIQAEQDYKRVKYLVEQKVKSNSELDQAKASYEVAKWNLKSQESNLSRAKLNLSYASIFSPVDGIVIARNVNAGQTVAANFSAPVLFQIAKDLSKMQILANVDEGDVGQIKEGQQVKFTVQSYPDRTFMGKVKQVRLLPMTVQNVVNYSVVVEVENPGNVLLPGMTATVDFITAKAEQVLKVPNGVLRFKATTKMMETFRKRLAQRRGENGSEKGGALRNGNNGRRGEGSPLGGSLSGNGMAKKINLLWYLDKKGELQATPVRLGATDGQMTEIRSDKIYEGMMVIKGVLEGESEGVTNPFQPTRRGPGPGPGGPPRGM